MHTRAVHSFKFHLETMVAWKLLALESVSVLQSQIPLWACPSRSVCVPMWIRVSGACVNACQAGALFPNIIILPQHAHPPRKTIYNAYSDLYAHKHPNNSTHIFRMPHILAHVTQYPRAQLKMTHMYTQNTPFWNLARTISLEIIRGFIPPKDGLNALGRQRKGNSRFLVLNDSLGSLYQIIQMFFSLQ